MQNDLISKSALIEALRKEADECEEEMTSPSFWTALRIVKEQPISYDMEKVVAELEKEGRTMMPVIPTKEAIDIVRNGGKE